jgi:hypothetical protein
VAADFNGDGKPDLAVADLTGSEIRMMTGDGSGHFSSPVSYPCGNSPSAILPGDFNNDGKLDIAFNHWFGDTVGLMLGDGRGGLGPETQFPAGGPSPLSNVAADFNRDGNLDMATAGWGAGGVRVLMGDGKGHFAPAIVLNAGSNTQRVVTADFNRDGNPDLAVSNWGDGTISVFLGDGRGGFARSDFAAGSSPISVKVGDFNRDGVADLAVGHGSLGEREGDISLLVGNESGGFAAPRPLGGPELRGFDVADFNFDGNSDLAYRMPGVDDTFFVRLGDGKLGFAAPTTARTKASELALAADYTGDRIPDFGAISAENFVVTRNKTVANGPVYEAEQAAITGAVVSRSHAGFTGTGYADFQNPTGDAVDFTVLVPAAGWYDLFSRYALKGSSRATALSVNGQGVSGGVNFAPTGSWTKWLDAVRTVQLKAGYNTVRVEASGQNGPNLDSLTVRLSQPPVAGTYQAEAGIVSGAKFANDHTGYTGSGFVDFNHASGDSVEFVVDVPAGGAGALDFRYANGGDSDRPLELRVDGAVVAKQLSFGKTGGWNHWNTVSRSTPLAAGRHTVRLTATGRNGPNLDALTVRAAPIDQTRFNPAAEFSASQNPNGVWSYGASDTLAGPITLHQRVEDNDGAKIWVPSGGGGVIGYNPTDRDAHTASTVTLRPGDLALHPGPDGQFAHVVFRAPAAGTYAVSGSFGGVDILGTTTDVHVRVNGSDAFTGDVNGPRGTVVPFSIAARPLKAGDTVDFAVGFGADRSYGCDTTLLDALVTRVS